MIKRTHDPKGQKTNRADSVARPPGRLVGIIAVRPKGLAAGEYNPLVMAWTVNPYRKDYNEVVEQQQKKPQLSKYSNDLFYSMFRKWGD
ncbi:hypothetical protein HWB91_gp50 [Bacillus phage vB_BboS-125]|uniref:Uncharacterized protein n=1 Tax=Bacillus phage vB_BboS-125 TaxID=2419618 RepID=A0A3G3BW86_9CAUD|nr:hypothetical protein HWB91_gp50 [Bacillus phage vB_BboS-125]AYP68420.1 hypothetical protein BboS125_00051 [Bacillus phage vB_BboS-125]